MKLLTAEQRATASLPPLHAQEKVPDPIGHAKFFTPDSNWTSYFTEGEAEEDDFRFFGYVLRPGGGMGLLRASGLDQFAARWASRSNETSTLLPAFQKGHI